jgi:hypothetical protein
MLVFLCLYVCRGSSLCIALLVCLSRVLRVFAYEHMLGLPGGLALEGGPTRAPFGPTGPNGANMGTIGRHWGSK